jgi:hypothetical protein
MVVNVGYVPDVIMAGSLSIVDTCADESRVEVYPRRVVCYYG